MEAISSSQLFAITTLVQVGTTIIFGFAAGAGRDAWVAMLAATLIGTPIASVYLLLARMNPGLTLVEWYPAQFGRWIGTPIAWLYPLVMIYASGRIVRDLVDLIPTTILPATPPLIFLVPFLLVIAYAVFHGIEVIGRFGQVVLPMLVCLFLFEVVTLAGSGVMHVEHLAPALDKGWGPIWEAVWPQGLTQTFGETVQFSLIWASVRDHSKVFKTTLAATLFSGLFMAVSNFLAITVLGEHIFERSNYPLYEVLRFVQIADFFTNIDAIGVLYFSLTAFMKISVYLYGTVRAIQHLTYMKSNRPLIIPVTAVSLFVGLTMADNFAEHIPGVHMKTLSPYLWIPLFFIFPGLLLIVTWVRRQMVARGAETP